MRQKPWSVEVQTKSTYSAGLVFQIFVPQYCHTKVFVCAISTWVRTHSPTRSRYRCVTGSRAINKNRNSAWFRSNAWNVHKKATTRNRVTADHTAVVVETLTLQASVIVKVQKLQVICQSVIGIEQPKKADLYALWRFTVVENGAAALAPLEQRNVGVESWRKASCKTAQVCPVPDIRAQLS